MQRKGTLVNSYLIKEFEKSTQDISENLAKTKRTARGEKSTHDDVIY